MKILVCNAGSTSLKFKVYAFPEETVLARGRMERVGAESGSLYFFEGADGRRITDDCAQARTYEEGIERFLRDLGGAEDVDAVAYKAVLSKGFPGVHVIDEGVLDGMRAFLSVAPVHNRAYLGAIEAFQRLAPNAVHVASFETAFHQTVPLHRRVYGVPYEWYEKYGVARMGYHGASHSYIASQLAAYPRVVSCHLGGSSSICAIKDGKSVDTSFGLSLQAGVTHVNRAGDIDPYIMPFLLREGMSYDEVVDGLEKKGGLAGIAGMSGDMRDLRAAAGQGNARAALAIRVFTSDVCRYIGAFAAEMGGMDALAFTGGIGENDAASRREICDSLGFLGVEIDERRNLANARRISRGRTEVFVIPADEERVVAENAWRLLKRES